MVKRLIIICLVGLNFLSLCSCSTNKSVVKKMVNQYVRETYALNPEEEEKIRSYKIPYWDVDGNEQELLVTTPPLEETLIYELWRTIGLYTSTYIHAPENLDDLIGFIETANYNDPWNLFHAHGFIVKNKDKLILQVHPSVNLYAKKVKPENLIIGLDRENPCDRVKTAVSATFFNASQKWIVNEALEEEAFLHLRKKAFSYKDNMVVIEEPDTDAGQYKKIIVEYLPGQLNNICSNKSINFIDSEYFKDIYNYLEIIAVENNFSRILVPIYDVN